MLHGPSDALREQVDKDGDDTQACPMSQSSQAKLIWREETAHTDFDNDEPDDDCLEALCVSAGYGLLEQLEHVLQDLTIQVRQAGYVTKRRRTSTRVLRRLIRWGISR